MCGVVGIIGSEEASKEAFLSLVSLQHRGQDAAGILSYDKSFHEVKNLGLVETVFTKESMDLLKGSTAVGHTRYSTAGKGHVREVQPLTLNYPYGIGIVHNGNIVNYMELKDRLAHEKKRICFSNSDTEALLNWLADELKGSSFSDLKTAVKSVYKNVIGSYSVVGILAGGGLFAFRDPNGIRPLVLGERKENGSKKSYMVASESISLQVSGYKLLRDIEPGELLYLEQKSSGEITIVSEVLQKENPKPCMFEWVYFASAESEVQSAAVYGVRLELGRKLADIVREKIKTGEIEADIVAPVPDTSRTAATSISESLKIPYREVLIKNRYIKRTFILGSQSERQRSVDLKLNPVRSEIEGKNVLLVDDSIVRGTTSRKIVELVRQAGAKKVYFLSTCPPIRFPCYYGIDFPDRNELLATNRTEKQIADLIGADGVVYLDDEGLSASIEKVSHGKVKDPCMACLNGCYPTEVKSAEKLTENRRLERGEKRV